VTSGRRSKALRAYERANTTLPERQPGEKGYAAYWRQEFGNAASQISDLKGQLNGTLSGRAIVGVMNVYGANVNNTSGQSRLGQQKIADLSTYGVRTVKRVQQWAGEYGWAEQIAPAVPGRVGKTLEMRVGWLPADDPTCGPVDQDPTCGPVDTWGPVDDVWARAIDMGASGDDVGASSGPQTLITNSHKDSHFPHDHPLHACCASCPASLAPSFWDDEEALDTETPSGPLPEEPVSNTGPAAASDVDMCNLHTSYPAGECEYCDKPTRESTAPGWRQRKWYEDSQRQNEAPGLDGHPVEGTEIARLSDVRRARRSA
jgi:hypothetical protein